MNIKFKEFKKYIAKTDAVSICVWETGNYCNYECIDDVSDEYDDLYFFGCGTIYSEFPISTDIAATTKALKEGMSVEEMRKTRTMSKGLEITLSETPRFEEKPDKPLAAIDEIEKNIKERGKHLTKSDLEAYKKALEEAKEETRKDIEETLSDATETDESWESGFKYFVGIADFPFEISISRLLEQIANEDPLVFDTFKEAADFLEHEHPTAFSRIIAAELEPDGIQANAVVSYAPNGSKISDEDWEILEKLSRDLYERLSPEEIEKYIKSYK